MTSLNRPSSIKSRYFLYNSKADLASSIESCSANWMSCFSRNQAKNRKDSFRCLAGS